MICTTGKISHIVSIMDGIDSNFNSIKPIYIIKDEIKNLFYKNVVGKLHLATCVTPLQPGKISPIHGPFNFSILLERPTRDSNPRPF